VGDDDLAALYSLTTGFCYVSQYEGFGLPLLEAMACGAPTIYGDNSSMPELAGDAGLPADATDVGSIVERMRQLLSSDALRSELSQRGMKRAREFSWTRAAEATIAWYRTTIERARHPDSAAAGYGLSADRQPREVPSRAVA
jgi:glycosyltransferase involved in cell wall biosynthesis